MVEDDTTLPTEPAPSPLDALVTLADGNRTMAELFETVSLPIDFATVNHARLNLTTRLNPYLVAIG